MVVWPAVRALAKRAVTVEDEAGLLRGESTQQFLAQQLGGDRLGQFARLGDADAAGLFTHDHGEAIVVEGYANGGAVTRAERVGDRAFLRQRQLHASSPDAAVADDDGQVVQRGIRPKDALQKGCRNFGVELGSAGDVADADLTLDHDEGAETVAGEELGGVGDFLGKTRSLRAARGEKLRAAEATHRGAQLGLKHHDQENGQQIERAVKEKAQPAEAVGRVTEDADHQRQRHRDEKESLDDARAARPAQEAEHAVHAEPDDTELEDDLEWTVGLEHIGDIGDGEAKNGAHRRGRSYASRRMIATS